MSDILIGLMIVQRDDEESSPGAIVNEDLHQSACSIRIRISYHKSRHEHESGHSSREQCPAHRSTTEASRSSRNGFALVDNLAHNSGLKVAVTLK